MTGKAAQRVVMFIPLLMLAAISARAQFLSSDAPFVTTPPVVVDAMLDIAFLNSGDYLIDLGSGDGRIPLAAARKFGLRAMGVEFEVKLVQLANETAKSERMAGNVTFVRENLLTTNIGRATVLTMYLSRQINLQMRPRILAEMRPGSRIVSHDFDMGEWKPDQRREISVPGKVYGPPVSQIYLWYVPAAVAGKWRWNLTVAGAQRVYEARLDQRFQAVDLDALVDGGTAPARNVRLRGDLLEFVLTREIAGQRVAHEFSGRVEGDRITGRVKIGGGGEDRTVEWVATRYERGKMNIE